MSNLLNSTKKNTLKRTPRIEPTETFELTEDVKNVTVSEPAVEAAPATVEKEVVVEEVEVEVTKKPKEKAKRKANEDATSIRVTKDTRARINALIQLGRADNADALLDAIIEEYVAVQLVPSEKKTFDILVKVNNKN